MCSSDPCNFPRMEENNIKEVVNELHCSSCWFFYDMIFALSFFYQIAIIQISFRRLKDTVMNELLCKRVG